jgi:excisionase family DNA binding protein
MNTKSPMRFYSIVQVADLLGVSPRSVRRWVTTRELLAHRFGRQVRISDADLRAFIEGRRS